MYKKVLTLSVAMVMAIGLFSCGQKSSDNGQPEETKEITNSESNENSEEGDEDVIKIEDTDYTN